MASKREIAEIYIFQAFLINSLSVLIRHKEKEWLVPFLFFIRVGTLIRTPQIAARQFGLRALY